MDISGFTSIYKYSPTADRGTLVADDVTIQNCVGMCRTPKAAEKEKEQGQEHEHEQ